MPRKGYKRTKEQIAKGVATRAANRAARLAGNLNLTVDDRIRDSLVFLNHALRAMIKDLKPGRGMRTSQLYVELAVRTLEDDL